MAKLCQIRRKVREYEQAYLSTQDLPEVQKRVTKQERRVRVEEFVEK